MRINSLKLQSEATPNISRSNSNHHSGVSHVKMALIDDFESYFKESSEFNIEKSRVYCEDNSSIFEKELPEELFVYILDFLTNIEIIKLKRVGRNFANYWTQSVTVWRGRSFGNDAFEPQMYFKPILGTPMQSIVYYYSYFLPSIINSYVGEENHSMQGGTVLKSVFLGPEASGKTELMRR